MPGSPGQEARIDREAAVEVTELVKSMLDGRVANPDMDYGGAIASFSTGRTAITFMGNWELQTFLKAGIPFDAMVMPNVFGTPATFGDSHASVLPHLVPQSHYAGAIDQAVFEPAAWFTGSGSDFQARVAEVMQACWLSGSSTPEQAVDGLIDRFNTMLAQNPPA